MSRELFPATEEIVIMGGLALVTIAGVWLAWAQDQRQRNLLDSGTCTAVIEALYTPPPRAHSSCSGDSGSQSCTTWYSQPDPYLRTLWRCPDPDRDGARVEFWRRSSERGESGQ